jgi:hypothetical protein
MSLPNSGQISLDDIHVVAGGTTRAQVSLNDTDVRQLIGSSVGSGVTFSDFYGAGAPTYYRYIKFLFKDVSSSAQELQVRHVNVKDPNGTTISCSATAISSDWSKIGNVTTTSNNPASARPYTSGTTAFYLDCGSGSQPHSYEMWSNDSGNPNRIPTEWEVYVSNSTTFPSTPHHTIDISYYSYITRTTHGWDWRTYSSSSTTNLISQNRTLYSDINGNYYTSGGTGREILWSSTSTSNSDILTEYYTAFLRVNFGSGDPNSSTRDTFELYT